MRAESTGFGHSFADPFFGFLAQVLFCGLVRRGEDRGELTGFVDEPIEFAVTDLGTRFDE
jgi:hypothetical protein